MTLDPVAAGGPHNVTANVQNDSATLTDVLFGDIWMCGGQSNMWFNMTQVRLSVSVLTFRFCLIPGVSWDIPKPSASLPNYKRAIKHKAKSSFFLKCI